MAVTPPISSFFGLDPRFLGGPAASSSLINPLLFGSSFQMVPINHGGFSSGIPPIFGGRGFTGFPTVPFDIFSAPSALMSPFSGSGAFGSGFGTIGFGTNQSVGGVFSSSPYVMTSMGGSMNQYMNPFMSQMGGMMSPYMMNPMQQMQYGFNANPMQQMQFGMNANPFGFMSIN